MEELSIEEKAKAYDEAIAKIVDVVEAGTIEQWLAEWLFPELKESEDERIRKLLIGVVELYYGNTDDKEKKDCLAWLEKQGSQNLANSAKTCKDEQNPAWSEEDEERLNSIIESYKDLLRDYKACHDVDYIPYDSRTVVRTVVNDVNYLKTLKERYTWKPSDEQIQALEYQVHSTFEGSWQYKASKELLEQLKKL